MHATSLLLGAALVILGVLASALADRIRGLRVQRPVEARRAEPPAPKLDPTKFVPGFDESPRAAERFSDVQKVMAANVIAALVGAGFKKAAASEAAWRCTATERETLEAWTQAALRRCAKGAVS